jgi:hypothetical protein
MRGQREEAAQGPPHIGLVGGNRAMIHIALRVAYLLFLAWLGLNVLLFTVLGVVALFSRPSGSPANEAREPSLTE